MRRKRSKNQLKMKSRVTSMERRSYKINEQGSESDEVSHEEQQHQADIESKNMAAKQQEVQQTTHTHDPGCRRAESP